MNLALKRANLIAKHQKELAELDRSQSLIDAFVAAGLPAPDFICAHDDHFSVQWHPESDQISGKWQPAAGAAMIAKLEPFLVPMEPSLKDKLYRSISPVAARGKGDYASDGIEFSFRLRQNAFGEISGESGPRYVEHSLHCWASVGGNLVQMEIKLSHSGKAGSIYWDRHGRRFVKPSISGSKLYSFGGGSSHSADVNYMFANLEDLANGLGVNG